MKQVDKDKVIGILHTAILGPDTNQAQKNKLQSIINELSNIPSDEAKSEAAIKGRVEDFKERIDKMGISDYLIMTPQEMTPNRFNLEIIKPVNLSWQLVYHAVMGLIAHFQNRNWVEGWSYTYIMKTHHSITFTDKSD